MNTTRWLFALGLVALSGQPLAAPFSLGQIVAAGVWLIVDGFFGAVGNRLPVY